MKTKYFTLAAVVVMVAALFTSCAASRKTGCPGNPTSSARFRG